MEDREFFDELYALWSKTTGASDSYWMPEEDSEWRLEEEKPFFDLFAVSQESPDSTETKRKTVASFLSDEDADFITAVHGCLPDLIRRLHEAIDEADRKDYEKDELEGRVGKLELEADQKERDLEVLTAEVLKKDERVRELENDLREADVEIHYLSARVQDLEGL
jgi:hypothetical protein